jgi:hypothetical protein
MLAPFVMLLLGVLILGAEYRVHARQREGALPTRLAGTAGCRVY